MWIIITDFIGCPSDVYQLTPWWFGLEFCRINADGPYNHGFQSMLQIRWFGIIWCGGRCNGRLSFRFTPFGIADVDQSMTWWCRIWCTSVQVANSIILLFYCGLIIGSLLILHAWLGTCHYGDVLQYFLFWFGCHWVWLCSRYPD